MGTLRLKPSQDDTVIACTPVIKPAMSTRGCIVIREMADEYVVHNVETDENGLAMAFYWGAYFKKDTPDALKNAVRSFVKKTMVWHGFVS